MAEYTHVTFDSPSPTAQHSETSTLSSMASLSPHASSRHRAALKQLMSDLQENGWTLGDMQLLCRMWQAEAEKWTHCQEEGGPGDDTTDVLKEEPTSPRKRRASRQRCREGSPAVGPTFSSSVSSPKPANVKETKVSTPPKRLKAAATAVMITNKLKLSTVTDRPLETDFDFVGTATLGRGALSVVKEVVHKRSKDHFACKCVDKHQLSLKANKQLLAEMTLMRELDHTNIVKLWHCYEDTRHYFIVMDLIEGGELFDRIVAKETYNEREARDVVRTILDVLGYLHYEVCVVHRDIKPENILVVSNDNDVDIKICDFGFAARLDMESPQTCLTRLCGTPQYVAPEILQRKSYGAAVDMWSSGVVTYILLAGYAPFSEKPNLNFNICRGNYSFYPDSWSHVSDEGKDFISQLLTLDPAQRMTAEEALVHPWIAEDGALLENHDLHENLRYLKRFNARTKFKAAAKTVIAVRRLASGAGSWTRPCKDADIVEVTEELLHVHQ